MASLDISPLEAAVLASLRSAYPGLTAHDGLRLISRENTGAGRFTTWEWSGPTYRDVLAPSHLVRMAGVKEPGLGVVLFIEPTELTLELFSFDGGWDGVERAFSIQASP